MGSRVAHGVTDKCRIYRSEAPCRFIGAVGDLSQERTLLQIGLSSSWEGVIQKSFVANRSVDSLKVWQMMGDAISWGASQPMLPSSSSEDTWWGCHIGVSRSICYNNQHTQPSIAARWMLILSSSIPSAALSAGLLEWYCPRSWTVHWWNRRGYPFPKQGIRRECRSPWKYAVWKLECLPLEVGWKYYVITGFLKEEHKELTMLWHKKEKLLRLREQPEKFIKGTAAKYTDVWSSRASQVKPLMSIKQSSQTA